MFEYLGSYSLSGMSLQEIFRSGVVLMLGLMVGSFLNVCIWRIPRAESIIFPRSHCPGCRVTLKVRNLIPVFSYLFQGGRCAYCTKRISPVYPLVETLTAFSFMAVLWWGPPGFAPKALGIVLLSTLIVVSFIDIRVQIIPDAITLPGVVVGIGFHGLIQGASALGWIDLTGLPGYTLFNSLCGAFLGGAALWMVAFVSEKLYGQVGMGGGDIKLAALIGAFVGWKGILRALLASFFLAAAIGLLLMVLRLKKRRDYMPFGPFLALGSAITFFYPVEQLGVWYMSLFGGQF